jgi:hypothetical protein
MTKSHSTFSTLNSSFSTLNFHFKNIHSTTKISKKTYYFYSNHKTLINNQLQRSFSYSDPKKNLFRAIYFLNHPFQPKPPPSQFLIIVIFFCRFIHRIKKTIKPKPLKIRLQTIQEYKV